MTFAQAEKYVDTIRALTSELSLRWSKNSALISKINHSYRITFVQGDYIE